MFTGIMYGIFIMKNIFTLSAVTALAFVTLIGNGCSYNHKDYPRESWFTSQTQLITAEQFKKVEQPLKVALNVEYIWEGEPIVVEPFDKRRADWRETYGLWFAAERYLEETGLFEIVDEDDEKKQGVITIRITRDMDPKTKAAIEAKKADPEGHPEKIVYEYDMTMNMTLALAGGKTLIAKSETDHMFIGHEDSEEKKVGVEPKRFTFSYFNNMDFHTEFTRRFYKQMIFEAVKSIEPEI